MPDLTKRIVEYLDRTIEDDVHDDHDSDLSVELDDAFQAEVLSVWREMKSIYMDYYLDLF